MEDYEFNINYFKYIDDISIFDRAFYNYMYNGDISASSKYQKDLLKRYYDIKQIRNSFYKKFDHQDKISDFNSSFLIICLNNLYKNGCNLNVKERKKIIKEIMNLDDFKRIKRKKIKTHLEKLVCLLSITNNTTLIDINFKIAHFIKNNFKFVRNIFRSKNRGDV